MYSKILQLPNQSIVHIEDFFVFDGHYFAASEYLGKSFLTFESAASIETRNKLQYLLSLAETLQVLHTSGIVHADLKPEHIVVSTAHENKTIRLIDFDSGFIEDTPPTANNGMDVDPVYMSPEAYLIITGNNVRLTPKLDTYTLALIAHQWLCGKLPAFDTEKYNYSYAAVLNNKKLRISSVIDDAFQSLLQEMLSKNPAQRPDDEIICHALRKALL